MFAGDAEWRLLCVLEALYPDFAGWFPIFPETSLLNTLKGSYIELTCLLLFRYRSMTSILSDRFVHGCIQTKVTQYIEAVIIWVLKFSRLVDTYFLNDPFTPLKSRLQSLTFWKTAAASQTGKAFVEVAL